MVIRMKRKFLCYILSVMLLSQSMQVFATENKETVDVQSEVKDNGTDGDKDAAEAEDSQNTEDQSKDTQNDESQNKDSQEAENQEKDSQNDENQSKDTQNGENRNKETSGSGIREALGAPVGVSAVVEAKTQEDYVKAYEDAKNANWGYTNLGIANVSNNLNIRSIPAIDGKLVGKLPKDAACEVIDSDGEWAHIKSGNVEGYVSCEFLLTGLQAKWKAEELVSTIATVTVDNLNVREEANTDAEVITRVSRGEELEVVESEGEWVKVYLDDEEVYVFAEFVRVDAKLQTAITMTELLYGQGISDVRVDLCQYAKQFLGNPYVWGGVSLTNGADCSGFVLSVFKKYGVTLPHYSGAQANSGTKISLSDAKPGDLVFYGKGQTINHVAIYIGNGQVIHASSPKTGIKISNVYYRTPLKTVRILQD